MYLLLLLITRRGFPRVIPGVCLIALGRGTGRGNLAISKLSKNNSGCGCPQHVDCALGRKGRASGLGSQRQGFGVSFIIALKDSLLPKQKGAAVTLQPQPSCGTASLGAGGKSLLFWQYAQGLIQGEKMTVVFCPCGGRTNSVSLLRRTAPSALARRTGHRPQPH